MLALYLLQFFLGKKKKPVTTSRPAPELEHYSTDSSGSNDFHEALAEISTMLSGKAPAPKPPDLSVGKVPSTVPGAGFQKKAPISNKALAQIENKSYFDDAFEGKEYISFHKPQITHSKLEVSVSPTLKKRSALSRMVSSDVRDRIKVQEAMVLAEVLGPPIGRRPPGRR